MSFYSKEFTYMPLGSYAIQPDGSVLFLGAVSDELKERFLKELKEKQERERIRIDPKEFV